MEGVSTREPALLAPESPAPVPPPPPSSPQSLLLSPALSIDEASLRLQEATGAEVSRAAAGDGSVAASESPEDATAGTGAAATGSSTMPNSASLAAPLMCRFSRTLVLDTGAFLRLKRLDQFGRRFVVPPSVLEEIRDARARAHLSGVTLLHPDAELPSVATASEADKRWARKFAQMTGDLGSLSDTDLDVIALTYMLQRQTGRVEKLRTKPLDTVVVKEEETHKKWDEQDWGKDEGWIGEDPEEEAEEEEDVEEGAEEAEEDTQETDEANDKREFGPCAPGAAELPTAAAGISSSPSAGAETSPCSSDAPLEARACGIHESREIVDVAADEDDGEGTWVTPENFQRVRRGIEGICSSATEEEALVACMTTDYSVQNVLLHMGLQVVTIDGLAIRSVKTWALICRACHFVSREVTRLFCPKCGQHAVDRVPVTLSEDGLVVHDNRKKKSTRGNVHSLPKPRGGRHEKQLILAEDQLMMGGRDRLLRHQQRLWETEKAAHNPFSEDFAFDAASAWHMRARTRTGKLAAGAHAPRVVVGLGPGNPNSNRWVKRHSRAKGK
ncbi:Nin one binding (NOB1) Zn-ribbon family protein [Besnoitia besnoiti]|uniref:Nin one binding (NOB1) Zn-ribbon family protein n=1 Tax=Besnoitia besnoiti TaxID=94643 RepID=A0A2A9MHM7_BESBE|nr:Nin one binding (NOB1) Zn-ribbon family protein [Besnoitia besnoiti]PFH37485.1 Nin one binding (NOB1) Zn-ribbon family protein [Besnoitia besnoiti]